MKFLSTIYFFYFALVFLEANYYDEEMRHIPNYDDPLIVKIEKKVGINDRNWNMQWYMNRRPISYLNQKGELIRTVATMNVEILLFYGFKGSQSTVVIISNDLVDYRHNEFASDYRFMKNMVFNPRGVQDWKTNIATRVASIIGMQEGNHIGGVGIVPRCKLGSMVVDFGNDEFSLSPDQLIDNFITHNRSKTIDVFVHVWKTPNVVYKDKLIHTDASKSSSNKNPPLSQFSKQPMEKPHVMGAGDLGSYLDTCQSNGYANLDTMFVFGSVDYSGNLAYYSNTGASVFAVTYSSSAKGGDEEYHGIVMVTSEFDVSSHHFPSTDISAAIGAGIIALIVDVFKARFQGQSPTISDIAFILASSCTHDYMRNKNTLWFQNAAGYCYSPQAGFGIPNAQTIFHIIYHQDFGSILNTECFEFDGKTDGIVFNCMKPDPSKSLDDVQQMETSNYKKKRWLSSSNMIFVNNEIECRFDVKIKSRHIIQEIGVKFSTDFNHRGLLYMFLISPQGTVSCILEGRPFDDYSGSYSKWYVRSNHFLGEKFGGQWTLRAYIYQPPGSVAPQESSASFKNLEFKAVLLETVPKIYLKKFHMVNKKPTIERDYNIMKEWITSRFDTRYKKEFNQRDRTDAIYNNAQTVEQKIISLNKLYPNLDTNSGSLMSYFESNDFVKDVLAVSTSEFTNLFFRIDPEGQLDLIKTLVTYYNKFNKKQVDLSGEGTRFS